MKSRATIYLLIVAVIVLWGVIVKKLLFSADKPLLVPKVTEVKSVSASITDTLTLNYNDPFLGKRKATKVAVFQAMFRGTPPKSTIMPREEISARYLGKIGSKRVVNYLIELNGALHTVKHGDIISDFCLCQTFEDSVHLSKNGNVYNIPRSK